MKRWGLVMMLTLVVFAPLTAQSLDVELQRAIQRETATGDQKRALADYRSIFDRATRPPRDRLVAAKALLRIAESHQKLGEAEARRWYELVVKDYPDLPQAVAARAALKGTIPRTIAGLSAHRAVWTVKDGGDIYGKVSLDGRYVPYTDWNEHGDLFLHDLASGSNRRLTNAASKATPAGDEWGEETAFSRDSRQLAFAWGKGDRFQLRTVNVDSLAIPQHRVLVDNPEIDWIWPEDWIPDGTKIVAGVQRIDGTAQIALVSTADGAVTVLKSLPWRGRMRMALSPAGDYLAYDLRGAETNMRDVFVLKIDGTREIAAVTHRSNDVLVGWSSDGTRLLFTSERSGSTGLWSVGFSDGRIVDGPVLVRADTGPMPTVGLTSSGALYMTTSSSVSGSEIKLARFDFEKGAFASALDELDQGDGFSASNPNWSRDGKFLAYTGHYGSRQGSDVALRIRSMDTGAIVKELRPNLSNFGFVWTPQDDGFLAAGLDFKGQQGLYRIDAATGAVTPVVVSKTGERVFLPIFDRSTANPDKFYYRRLIGQESVLLERAFSSGAEREIARGVQVGISVRRQKTYSRRANGNQEGVIVERDLESGAEREVFRHKHLTQFVGAVARPGMFADSGRFIAVVTEPSSKTVTWLSVSVESGEPRELIRVTASERLAPFTVSPDGSTAFAKKTSGSNSELLRLPLDGSSPSTVQFSDISGVIGFAIHPDGRQVAFETTRGAARLPYEVWVLENFLPRSSTR